MAQSRQQRQKISLRIGRSLRSFWLGRAFFSDFRNGTRERFYCGMPEMSKPVYLFAKDIGFPAYSKRCGGLLSDAGERKNLLMLGSCRCLWGIFLECAPTRPARPLSDARFLLTPAIILSRALGNAVRRSL